MKSMQQNLKQKSTQYCSYTNKSCSVHAINCGDTDVIGNPQMQGGKYA